LDLNVAQGGRRNSDQRAQSPASQNRAAAHAQRASGENTNPGTRRPDAAGPTLTGLSTTGGGEQICGRLELGTDRQAGGQKNFRPLRPAAQSNVAFPPPPGSRSPCIAPGHYRWVSQQ
jgi:hypothetical protein